MEHILSMQHVTKNYGRFCLARYNISFTKGLYYGTDWQRMVQEKPHC